LAPTASKRAPALASVLAARPVTDEVGGDPAAPEFEAEAGDANWPDGSAGSALRDLVLARNIDTAPDNVAEARCAAVTPAVNVAGTDPEPCGLAVGAPQGTAVPAAQRQADGKPDDTANARSPAELSIADPAPDNIPAEPRLFEGEIGLLDEDTLRDIIADVVREELQGVLGQRITRNVRKMVRREIRLALAAGELD
jgi:hypothetical protein